MKTTIQEYLFKDFTGCSNHSCVINKRVGVGTNGPCHCLHDLTKQEFNLLKYRLYKINNVKIEIGEE